MVRRAILRLLLAALAGACGSAAAGLGERDAGPVDAWAQSSVDDAWTAGTSEAAPPAPVTATEACTRVSGPYLYAEHAFPGRTAAQLAAGRAVGHLTISAMTLPNFYTRETTAILVRDGYAAASCGLASSPAFDAVDFTAP